MALFVHELNELNECDGLNCSYLALLERLFHELSELNEYKELFKSTIKDY